MADVPYESGPGALKLAGITAELQGIALYEATPGALVLLGAVASVLMPVLRVLNLDRPYGVRGSSRSQYPRRVEIYNNRYTVRSPQEEQALLQRLADDKGKKEKKKKKASPKPKARTVYTIRGSRK
jgi:hypothetical protein